MFDWNEVTDGTAVHCKTKAEANDFMVECEKHGLKWNGSRNNPTSDSYWGEYVHGIVYWPSADGITHGSPNYAEEKGCPVLEFSDLCNHDRPRTCEILCPERPLEIGEKFQIKGYEGTSFWVDPDGFVEFSPENESTHTVTGALSDAINHPEKIIRRPQVSEDGKVLFRLLVSIGLPWVARDKNGLLWAYKEKPKYEGYGFSGEGESLPRLLLIEITPESSPLDVRTYL